MGILFYHCSYCKGRGHFNSNCLKRLTKDCSNNICRDYNRFEHTACCTADGSCIHNRKHVCIFCNSTECKAYNHIHPKRIQIAQQKLSQRNAAILQNLENLSNLVYGLKEKLDTITKTSVQEKFTHSNASGKISELPKQHEESEDRTTSHTSEGNNVNNILKNNGSLAIPVISAKRQVMMGISPSFPLSAVSLKHANEIAISPTTSIVPLQSGNMHFIAVDLSFLKPCGTMNVPITFENTKTFCFQMVVIPNLSHDLIFGQNHLRKTDAEIHHAKLKICFRDPAMNFETNCHLVQSSHIHAFTSLVDIT